MRRLIVHEAVESQAVYGRWRVEGLVGDSKRRVQARCLDCDTLHVVDLYGLRRKDRANNNCKSCSNKQISANNKLPPGEALLRNQMHEYKKAARVRGHSWGLDSDSFRRLVYWNCYYCGQTPSRVVENSWDSITINGIDRKDNSVGYEPENCVPCCQVCNYSKGRLSAEDFISLCRRVAKYDISHDRPQE